MPGLGCQENTCFEAPGPAIFGGSWQILNIHLPVRVPHGGTKRVSIHHPLGSSWHPLEGDSVYISNING